MVFNLPQNNDIIYKRERNSITISLGKWPIVHDREIYSGLVKLTLNQN